MSGWLCIYPEVLWEGWPWSPLCAVGDRQYLVDDGFSRCFQLHLFQQLGEATTARFPPVVDLVQDTAQRDGRQVQTQRLQHTHDDRLPTVTHQRLSGPP